jgi:AAA+ ATPase superfamily predicted ATPase
LQSRFVDRKDELRWLEEHWRSGRAELLLVYGRRRVGKTRLLREFSKSHRVFYFVAEEVPEKLLLERLSKELAEFLGDELLAEHPFTSWRQFLLYLERIASKRTGVVIDEFQYAVSSSPALLSLLQNAWDTRLRDTGLFLVLAGSLVSFTEGVLSYRSPLYGRFTGVMKLRPLGPFETRCFVPSWDPGDALRLYGVFGGIPGYLVEIDPGSTLWDNVARLVLSPNARFLDEAKYLLREELREVTRYFAVLEAIARGATTYGEIASKSGIPAESLSKYLRVLEEMELIRREQPVVGKGRSRYIVSDPFLRFWFRYVPAHRAAIELGLTERVVETVRRDFEENLMPIVWEEVAASIIAEKLKHGWLGITPTRIGKWWYRGAEIDIVVVDDSEKPPRILVAEAKWSSLSAREARRILDNLRAKAAHLPVKASTIHYVLAARELEEEPQLLGNEHTVTMKDYEELSRKACK